MALTSQRHFPGKVANALVLHTSPPIPRSPIFSFSSPPSKNRNFLYLGLDTPLHSLSRRSTTPSLPPAGPLPFLKRPCQRILLVQLTLLRFRLFQKIPLPPSAKSDRSPLPSGSRRNRNATSDLSLMSPLFSLLGFPVLFTFQEGCQQDIVLFLNRNVCQSLESSKARLASLSLFDSADPLVRDFRGAIATPLPDYWLSFIANLIPRSAVAVAPTQLLQKPETLARRP